MNYSISPIRLAVLYLQAHTGASQLANMATPYGCRCLDALLKSWTMGYCVLCGEAEILSIPLLMITFDGSKVAESYLIR